MATSTVTPAAAADAVEAGSVQCCVAQSSRSRSSALRRASSPSGSASRTPRLTHSSVGTASRAASRSAAAWPLTRRWVAACRARSVLRIPFQPASPPAADSASRTSAAHPLQPAAAAESSSQSGAAVSLCAAAAAASLASDARTCARNAFGVSGAYSSGRSSGSNGSSGEAASHEAAARRSVASHSRRSTMTRSRAAKSSQRRQYGSCRSVSWWPTATSPLLARVRSTLSRRQSERKPTAPWLFARTAENRMTSFSRP
mmetsp:Transcript_8853/g.27953  ORF Transcript_8853/g.27953 Transcript_8853/m.27953 type:complete len:258 (-) Transcript_8853:796-1569(-)